MSVYDTVDNKFIRTVEPFFLIFEPPLTNDDLRSVFPDFESFYGFFCENVRRIRRAYGYFTKFVVELQVTILYRFF